MYADHTNPAYPLSALTGKIIAAAQEVHRTLGPGFRELIYQRALERELDSRGIEASREVWIDVVYKGLKVGRHRVDFVVGDASGDVMVETKAKSALDDVDFVQTLSYLKASGYGVALLINFGAKSVECRRLANTKGRIADCAEGADSAGKSH